MNVQEQSRSWAGFQAANRFRRAIREFKASPIAEDDVFALLSEAAYAPSSGNLQPYELHWVRTDAVKSRLAQACNGQKAAVTAADLIVVVASPELAKQTARAQLAHIEASSTLGEKSKAYHRKHIKKFQNILGIGASALWSPLLFLAALIRPAVSLLPVGALGSRHWAARSAIFAAQTLMLAAAAKGIDSCPMEGFSAVKVAEILGLPRGSVIPLVIALGYRTDTARVEERWRRAFADIVVAH